MIDIQSVLARVDALASEQHAIAETIRALPDADLIAMATRGAIPPSTVEEVARKHAPTKPAGRHPAPKSRTVAPRHEPEPTNMRDAASARRARVLDHLRDAGDFVRGADVARAMGEPSALVAADLRQLASDGLAESNGKNGLGCMYRVAGRQTGAKAKPSRRAKSADEEEPAPLELAPVDSAPRERQRAPRLLGPIRAPGPLPLGAPPDDVIAIAETPEPRVAERSLPPPATPTPIVERGPLPMLEPGLGERRDCVHERGCLDRFVAAHKQNPNGRCPAGCPAFEKPVRSAVEFSTGGASPLAIAMRN